MIPDVPRDDDAVISALLREAGTPDDPELADILRTMRASVPAEPPIPSAEVGALLAGEPGARVSSLNRHRRAIATTLILTLMLAGGVSAAAASPDVRSATHDAIGFLVRGITPAPKGSTTPAHPGPSDDSAGRPITTPGPDARAHGESGSTAPPSSKREDAAAPSSKREDAVAPSSKREDDAAQPRPTAPPRHGEDPSSRPTPPESDSGSQEVHSQEPEVPEPEH